VIDLRPSDENLLVQRSVREFAEAEITPYIRDWDAGGEVHREVFERMAEGGLLGAPIHSTWGGGGMDYLSFAMICEELERADTAFRVIQSVHVALNSLTLMQWATEEQRQRWLVPQAKGEKLATFALTEPGVGTDAANLASTARRDGESYVLNGQKQWISLAENDDWGMFFGHMAVQMRPAEGAAEARSFDAAARLQPRPATPERFVGELRATLDPSSFVTGRLRELQVPALILAGGRDQVVPPDATRQVADALPDARFALDPECGHTVRSSFHGYHDLVEAFLAEGDRDGG